MSEPQIAHLTKTEKEVWAMLVKAKTGKEIATARFTTVSAVWNIARIIYAKMGVRSQEELIRQNWELKNASGKDEVGPA